VLVFNDGNFSEDSTFLLSDWMRHTPPEVLAKNLNVPASAFANLPKKDLWIFNAPLPGSLGADLAQSSQPFVPDSYSFPLMDQPPIRTKSGTVRIADKNNFKASDVMSAALVEIEPGGLRELHWHPTSDEWQY
jgi:oxalate decarboxylase